VFSEFERLNDDKKNNIINASIHVFAQKGYKKAATDDIIQFAGISKGSLFVYFKNKQNLFLYVYDFVLETIIKELLQENTTDERDVLERLKKFFLAELELVKKYPDVFEFVKMVNMEDIPILSQKILERNLEKVNHSYTSIFKDIDETRFKDDVEIEDALNIIRWTLNGLSDRYRSTFKKIPLAQLDFCLTKEEVNRYFKLFQKLFYKTED
jgi:TetR/AcrR family transcriptional regulator